MANAREQDSLERIDLMDNSNDEDDFEDSSSCESSTFSNENSRSRREIGLTDTLLDEGDGDLLLQPTDGEDRLLQWLQALDMQFLGACRSAERLKPLLKSNVSNGVAEDLLLAQLSQHFEPVEVGMLARCFFIPLVSIRVGKIDKQGNRLCPTSHRGNLTLTLLPTSDLLLSFIPDNGNVEMIFTFTSKSQCSTLAVDDIPADSTGRSFLIRTQDGRIFYFWCSEKSKLLGIELLVKMKDLLKRKPSIADLSGICKSRLDCFATHLCPFLVGANNRESSCSSTPSAEPMYTLGDVSGNAQMSATSKFLRPQHGSSQTVKENTLYHGSLSPRTNSFKEGPPKMLLSFRNAGREKIRRAIDSHWSRVDNLTTSATSTMGASCNDSVNDKHVEVAKSCALSPSSILESLGKLAVPPCIGLSIQVPPLVSPLFSPSYCWCPPGILTLPTPAAPPRVPFSSIESPLLPPLSSLLSTSMPASLLTSIPSLYHGNTPSMDFPSFLPDPFLRNPLLRLPLPTSHHVPTFTPLMCDPIVHIPIIDVCSLGQGNLVNASPAISTAIPPLHSKLAKPLIPENDSVMKGVRETVRLLISSSSQVNQQINDFPAVLTNSYEKQNITVAGSQGLYSGTRDIDVNANNIAAMGLVSLSGVSRGDSNAVLCNSCEISGEQEKSGDLGGGFPDHGGMMLDFKEKRID
ncbi:Flocculation protein [Quillaja saponaria]|uniref:Flocculation protein n=1 Tax=Quillaja saponaria TaxID=32244 RepID=A0AAD7PL75_QUISA|nr:Flocculation protein [Quillaja saponaria]